MKNAHKPICSSARHSPRTIAALKEQYADLLRLRKEVSLLENANNNGIKRRHPASGQLVTTT
jgi:hypothetical protein